MQVRKKIVRSLGFVFLFPIEVAYFIAHVGHPVYPDWLEKYSDLFPKLAGIPDWDYFSNKIISKD